MDNNLKITGAVVNYGDTMLTNRTHCIVFSPVMLELYQGYPVDVSYNIVHQLEKFLKLGGISRLVKPSDHEHIRGIDTEDLFLLYDIVKKVWNSDFPDDRKFFEITRMGYNQCDLPFSIQSISQVTIENGKIKDSLTSDQKHLYNYGYRMKFDWPANSKWE